MKRRAALGLTGTVIAGGIGWNLRGDSHSVELEDQSDAPAGIPTDIQAQIKNNQSTYSNPATLEIRIHNQYDEDIVISGGKPAVFSYRVSEPANPGVILKPQKWDWLKHPFCIKSLRKNSISTELRTKQVRSGSSVIEEYAIWGQRSNDIMECVPTGTFDFESRYQLGIGIGNGVTDEEFDWGFTLNIS
ncbi:MAG: hypothetical protein ABEH88_11780 [Halobacteriales archaeon]